MMARMTRREKRDPDPKPKHKDHDPKKKPKPKKKPPGGGTGGGPVSESLKAKSTQSGQDAMGAVPGSYPAEPANAEAVYTTGPGQAVEYNYTRLGTYSEDYAQQQSEYQAPVPPIAGYGQVLTAQSAQGAVTSGAANNPT